MRSKRGFTLIELLAVIVILAVIALIATPIIMNVINDSKKGAAKDSAYGYISAATIDVFRESKEDKNKLHGNYTVNEGGNLIKDDKEIIVNVKGSKPTSGAITLGSDGKVGAALKIGQYCVIKYMNGDDIYIGRKDVQCDATISSNLVKNGYGELGNNTNFSKYTYEDDYSFSTPLNAGGFANQDTAIPIDTNKKYLISADVKSTNTKAIYHMGIYELDIDRKEIYPSHISSVPNTLTTLTQDLNNGDTVVHLNDITNFANTASTPTYQLGFVFWNYKDSTGYQYPAETYSRNTWDNLYTYNNINKANHTITLKEAWNHGTIKAGTALSQSHSSGSYNYGLLLDESISTTYQTKYNEMTGEQGGYHEKFFRPATKYIGIFLMPRLANPEPGFKTNIKNISIREVDA